MAFQQEIKDYFKSQNYSYVRYPSGTPSNITDLAFLKRRINEEYDFWNELFEFLKKKNQQLANKHPVMKVKSHFEAILKKIKSIEGDIKDQNQTEKILDSLLQTMKLERFPNINCSTDVAHFTKKIVEDFPPGVSEGFLKFFFMNESQDTKINQNESNSGEFLLGIQMAYSMKYEGMKRQIFNSYKLEIDELASELKRDHMEYLEKLIAEEDSLVNQFKDSKESMKSTTDSYHEQYEEWQGNLEKLEKRYEEHLKLKKPADYWKEVSVKYEEKGRQWRTTSLLTGSGFGLIMLILLTLINFQNQDFFDLGSIKITVILTVIVTIGFLLLNLFIKLTISNFHLANDALERHHLTYVYLALLEEAEIEGEEKNIILHSLFLRSDSGLVKTNDNSNYGQGVINAFIKDNNS